MRRLLLSFLEIVLAVLIGAAALCVFPGTAWAGSRGGGSPASPLAAER